MGVTESKEVISGERHPTNLHYAVVSEVLLQVLEGRDIGIRERDMALRFIEEIKEVQAYQSDRRISPRHAIENYNWLIAPLKYLEKSWEDTMPVISRDLERLAGGSREVSAELVPFLKSMRCISLGKQHGLEPR
jgi:hypothetical protein